jgi:hypothetical protein
MIPETVELLRLWQPGMIPARLADRAVEEGIFSRSTARRSRNLAAEMFAPRYLVDGGEPARRLKYLLDHRVKHEALVQLCFLYTARAQRVLADFIVEVYWSKYAAGASQMTRDDALAFIHRALDSGKMAARWSESTVKRVSGYLIGCCVDFGLLAEGTRSARPIQRFAIRPEASLYLVHDLHFAGLGDMSIVQHPNWRLFGLEPQEVVREIKKLGNDGHLLAQSSGELIQVSWKYRSMEDFLHALTQK